MVCDKSVHGLMHNISQDCDHVAHTHEHLMAPVYQSVAECMPDEPIVVTDNPFEQADEQTVKEVQAFIQVLHSGGAVGTAATALQVSQAMPRKYLPPGCPKDHWWTYLASPWRQAGSYTTFKRVWKECFRNILTFRPFGTHACCSTCAELTNNIRIATSMAEKIRLAEAKRLHLEAQWRDRLVYWRLRAASQSSDGSWLVVRPPMSGVLPSIGGWA